jgi:5-methylcytosine-specific restriction endonuclease McrA
MVPIQINNSYADSHYNDIKDVILHHIDRIVTKGQIKKDNAPVILSPHLRVYLTQLSDLTNNSLKDLILLSPQHIVNYVNNQNQTHSTFIDEAHPDNIILKNIFVTHGYEKNLEKWDFINKIKIDTCPYCNRNYIYTTSKNKEIKPEIDHFYPKSKYPILGLSYFNLIPSCKSCNGFGAKEAKDPRDEGLKNPYMINNDDFILSHKINNIAIINPLSGKSDVEVFFKKAIQGHLNVFNLKELYELHHDHAIELIIKQRLKYSKKYRDYLMSYDGMKYSKAEVDRMILGNYSLEKEQHKRPLSKLYQDIGKELGLIK